MIFVTMGFETALITESKLVPQAWKYAVKL